MTRQQYARFGRQFMNFAQQQFTKNAGNASAHSARKASSQPANQAHNFFQNARKAEGGSMFRFQDKLSSMTQQQSMKAMRQQFERVAAAVPALMTRGLSTGSAASSAVGEASEDGSLAAASGSGDGALSVNDSKGTSGVKRPSGSRIGR